MLIIFIDRDDWIHGTIMEINKRTENYNYNVRGLSDFLGDHYSILILYAYIYVCMHSVQL